MGRFPITVLCLAACLAAPALSQDLPARTGRLAYVDGPVSIQQSPDGGWEPAQVNRPLASGTAVLTEAGARAEVRVSSTSLRLGEGTQLALTRIDDDAIDAMVAAGSVIVQVRSKVRRERYTFSTPQAAFVIDAEGTYRVDYDPVTDESRLMVSSGSAHAQGPGGTVVVSAGKTLHLAGGDPSSGIEEGLEEDELDQWARSRESAWSDSTARRYVSPYMTGYEDLDANGQWATDPDYGPVWSPSNVDASWAPYSDGRWADVQPWGWTWIDNAPWGYAPFHYGRWVFVRNRWGWCPGPRVGRPVYAPALVAWTGGTPGPSASGWYPLAPWERLQPWYRASPGHVDRVNVAVRDRPPPRDWRGSPEGWRSSNRDHGTTTTNHGNLPPRNVAPPARPKPVNADALQRARESSHSRQQQPPRESQPAPARPAQPRPPQAPQTPQAPQAAQAARPPAPPAQPPQQHPAAPQQHPAERSERNQEK